MVTIEFKKISALATEPLRMTARASGYDLSAAIDSEVTLLPGDIKLISTGLAIALPIGFEAQIRPRSGLALKHGIGILNAPGTIDADYRGEIGIILFNASKQAFTVTQGMRIAQMVIASVPDTFLIERDELSSTHRETGGFGHTGF